MQQKDTSITRLNNNDRWNNFIQELVAYIELHHLCPPKHTALYNTQRYYRRKMKEGTLDAEKATELEEVLAMRDLSIHTGGRKKHLAIKAL